MDLNDGDSSEEDEDIKVNIPTFLDKSSVNGKYTNVTII